MERSDLLGRTLGHYTVRERIGAGGMGEVYRAWDTRLERDVALKVLPAGALTDDHTRKRFRKEALALSKLNHANIATVHDFNTQDGIDFLVMEYIPGTTLTARLGRPMLESEAIELGTQIAAGLREAHESGMIHRDLKPGNVIVTPKKQVKILDFGLAQLVQPDSDMAATVTDAGHGHALVGTLPYMSPEQLRGQRLDPRSDIHALGAVLYEMATGVRPFREETMPRLVESILCRAPEPPSAHNAGISPSLEGIILKCLEKDPENRYQSAKEVGIDLRRLATGATVSTTTRTIAPPQTGASRRTLAWVAGVVLLLALSALAVWKLRLANELLSVATQPAGVNSLVVLPCKVFGDESEAFLSDAVPSSLTTRLNQVAGLETKIPPSSLEMERLKGDIEKVVEAYEVNAFVLSSVNIQKQRLILNVQLVEARTRRLLWSNEFEGQRQNYLELVRGAAEGIRNAIRPQAAALPATGAEASADVELMLQRGLYHANLYARRGHAADQERALAALKRVLELDPERAEAAAEIARMHAARFTAAPLAEFRPQAQDWALRALKIDPRSSKAWAVLAEVEPAANYRRKLEFALKAASLDGRDAYAQAQLSSSLARSSFALSLEASRQASRMDPLVLNGPLNEALLLAGLGSRPEALARVEQALRIEPDMPFGLIIKNTVLIMNRQTRRAVEGLPQLDLLVKEKRLLPQWVDFQRELVTFEQKIIERNNAAAEEAAARLVKLARGESPYPRWQIATMGVPGVLARHGRTETAIQLLNHRHQLGIIDTYDYLLLNPDYESIRRDPRFPQLATAAKAGFEELVSILNEAKSRDELPQYLERPLADVLQRVELAANARR